MALISEALRERLSYASYYVSCTLAAGNPEQAVLEGHASAFDVRGFAAAGHCAIAPREHEQVLSVWDGKGISTSVQNAVYDVAWDGKSLVVVLITLSPSIATAYWIVAPTKAVAEDFYTCVCRWSTEIRSEILVFSGGQFYKDEALYRDIKSASLDKIILPEGMKEQVVEDLRQFFAAKPLYEKYAIPWKRGALFLGPPGNGKTLMIKALISELGFPCIYVKSFDLPMQAYPQAGINAVFARARQSTPCILVLEDLDALIGDHNRSFFLNELDGFASNAGIVTLATTNHPERLDASILERPSRFDRKYHFELPGPQERERYIALWNSTLVQELTVADDATQRIVKETEGFSFAYIKEMYLSAMMRWAAEVRKEAFADVLLAQTESLRVQMSETSNTVEAAAMPDIPPEIAHLMAMRHQLRSGFRSSIRVVEQPE